MNYHIYLLRHCEYHNPGAVTIAGRLPFPLTPEGVKLAQRINTYFKDKDIQHIITSPVKRAAQTAEIVADEIIPLSYDIDLAETFTAMQGNKASDPSEITHYHYGFRHQLGGESFEDIQKRMIRCFTKMKAMKQNIILCSHGDPIYFLWCYLQEQSLPDENNLQSFNNVETCPTGPYPSKGSILPIRIEGQHTTIEPFILL